MGLPMHQRRPRVVRIVRVRLRRSLRRLAHDPPEWLRWLTPWGTSLALHALLLFLLAVYVYARAASWIGESTTDRLEIAGQLRDDVTALKASDHAGDPFSTLKTDEPPSLSLHPD